MIVPTEKPQGIIVQDAEFVALNKIVKQLTALDVTARERVMAYLNSRFAPQEKQS